MSKITDEEILNIWMHTEGKSEGMFAAGEEFNFPIAFTRSIEELIRLKSDDVSHLNNTIVEFEGHPVLSEVGFWKYKNALRVETLQMVLGGMSGCDDLGDAANMVQEMIDAYKKEKYEMESSPMDMPKEDE